MFTQSRSIFYPLCLILLACSSCCCLAHEAKKKSKGKSKSAKCPNRTIKKGKKGKKFFKKGYADRNENENSLFSVPSCQAGDLERCVPFVVDEMRIRLCELHCDHDAIFAIIYLYTTEGFLNFAPALNLENLTSVVQEDALFADYYFRAYDAYQMGAFDEVPPAWKVTFDASSSKSVSSQANGLLGMITHIQRDLPLVLYELYKAGTLVSEMDHFAINGMFLLQEDSTPLIQQFYDPVYPNATVDELTTIIDWRAKAWVDYQRLVVADVSGNETEISAVVEGIELSALQTAQFVVLASPTSEKNEERDSFCELNLEFENI